MSIQTEANDDGKDYKTDEFGRAVDKNYHYRIPTDNDAAMMLASWALHGLVKYSDRLVTRWDGHSGDGVSYIGIETRDNKGHLDGLAKYAHSPEWQDMGVMSDIDEYRQNPSGGGTKVRGTFKYQEGDRYPVTLQFETVVDPTPTELEDAYNERGETWDSVMRTVEYAKQDAAEQYRQDVAEARRNCEHEHFVRTDGPGRVAGYCEDCGAELDTDKNLI